MSDRESSNIPYWGESVIYTQIVGIGYLMGISCDDLTEKSDA